MTGQVVSVGILTAYIREVLERDELLADVWIEGEIFDLFQSRAGHVYFTLKDSDSQLRCVLFQALARRQRQTLRPGDQVAAHGRISVYQRDGQYQLYADAVQPAGIGLLALQLELLRQQLDAEGLFDPARKRPIPASPRCIGVVTSPDGAVWHDIQHVLRRRYPFVELVLAPATVQGERAPATIVSALESLQADGRADVIIVARGGGSTEDLWCFNDERVVRAVFACRVPVVSAVGHETDWTLIDDVADLRAPTPSAAAEICSPSVADLAERLVDLTFRLQTIGVSALSVRRGEASQLARLLHRSDPRQQIGAVRAAVSAKRVALSLAVNRRLQASRSDIRHAGARASRLQASAIHTHTLRAKVAGAKLASLNPRAVLDRGYAVLVADVDGRLVHSSKNAAAGDVVHAHLRDGSLRMVVSSESPRKQSKGASRG